MRKFKKTSFKKPNFFTNLKIHFKLPKFHHKMKPGKLNKTEKVHTAGRKSFRRRILGSMVCLTVAISVAISVVLCAIFYQSERSSIEKQSANVALAYDEAVKDVINNYKLSIQAIATNPSITDSKTKADWSKSLKLLLTNNGFSDGGIADASGKTIDGKDVSSMEFFQNGVSSQGQMSSTVKLEDGTMVFCLSCRVNNNTGYDGVVYAYLPFSTFNQVIGSISMGDKGYAFVTDVDGKVIGHKDGENVEKQLNYMELAKKDSSYSEIGKVVQQMTVHQSGKMYLNFNGSKYVFYAPIVGTQWSLAVVADVNEMMSNFYTSIWYIIIAVVVLVGISVIIAFRVANPVVRPIVTLVKRIESLAQGDLHSEVPEVHTQDEIETLSNTFRSTIVFLNNYIEEISNVLGSMAAGDFTARTEQEYLGDFATIKEALNTIVASMNGTFDEIHSTAEQVAGGSQQMAGASQALAQGASEQSGTIQELSNSVHQIAEQADRSAQSASKANELSNQAVDEVAGGTERINRMSSAMEKIRDSSAKIEKIIKTIQDIAFQTNILALNAAVEAARAGEAGKGFSVVADEVRNLANRSAEAVKSTAALIQDSADAVEDGQKIADDTADYLKNVITTVKKMSDLLQSISTSAGEQADSVRAVNGNVEQISAVVQTNSATAEESAATSEELSKLAASLNDTLARFQLSKA